MAKGIRGALKGALITGYSLPGVLSLYHGLCFGQGWIYTRCLPDVLRLLSLHMVFKGTFGQSVLQGWVASGRLQAGSLPLGSSGAGQFSARPGNGLLVYVGEDAAWAQQMSLAWLRCLGSLQAGGLCGCCTTSAVETC